MIKLKGKLVSAPMADFSDISFRQLCKKYGASLVYTEMTNILAISRNNKATLKLTQTTKQERPVALQLFGTKLEPLSKAIKLIENNADIIDFNFGCPAKKIISQGAGSALLKRPQKIVDIIQTIKQSTKKPISAKIRILNLEKTLNITKKIEKAGADLICVHARTPSQNYNFKPNLKILKEIKKSLSIPVIGNGGVHDEESLQKMLKTKVDYVMIGKASLGNPLIFKRLNYFLETGEIAKPTTSQERIKTFIEYLDLSKKNKNLEFRKIKLQANCFMRGLKGAAKLREKINNTQSLNQIKEIIINHK